MNDEPESNAEIKSTPAPNIPPPDLSRKAAAPESPLNKIKQGSSSTPPPTNDEGAAVKVKLHSGDSSENDGPAASNIAPFNTRVIAVIIDLVICLGIYLGLVIILPGFAEKLAFLAAAGYFITRDSLPFLGGQSVGKKAMKIRAVTRDGKPLTGNWEPSLIRAGVLCIPFFFVVELYLLLTREGGTDRGQRLGDEWAKTRVIVEPAPKPSEED